MAPFASDPRFSFHEQSITEESLHRAVGEGSMRSDAVFHLAAIVSVPYSMEHEQETRRVNFEATRALHEAAVRSGAGAFVFAGSAAEYGDLETLPLKESDATPETRRLSPYGECKYLSSRHIEQSGFGCSLRFFNIFGPRQDPSNPYSGVISLFMDRAVTGRPLTIHGDGLQSRDFIYVDDVIDSYMLASGLAGGRGPLTGVFNVGWGARVSILELAEMIHDLAGTKARLDFGPSRPGDIRHSQADVSKFIQAAGFSPKVPMREGLSRTMSWHGGAG